MLSKINWQGVGESLWLNKKWIILIGSVLVLLAGWFFLWDAASDWWWKRTAAKTKAAIETKVEEKKQIEQQIQNLQLEKARIDGEIIVETEELNKDLVVNEDLKKQADVALENYKKAVETKSDTDRSAQDLIDALKKLEEAQK